MAKAKKSTKKTKVVSKPLAVKRVKKPTKASKKITHFKMSKESTPFMTFKLTEQTLYWFVMLSLIFSLSLWVLSIQLKTTYLLESISLSFM